MEWSKANLIAFHLVPLPLAFLRCEAEESFCHRHYESIIGQGQKNQSEKRFVRFHLVAKVEHVASAKNALWKLYARLK